MPMLRRANGIAVLVPPVVLPPIQSYIERLCHMLQNHSMKPLGASRGDSECAIAIAQFLGATSSSFWTKRNRDRSGNGIEGLLSKIDGPKLFLTIESILSFTSAKLWWVRSPFCSYAAHAGRPAGENLGARAAKVATPGRGSAAGSVLRCRCPGFPKGRRRPSRRCARGRLMRQEGIRREAYGFHARSCA